jgi:hypothetical protein
VVLLALADGSFGDTLGNAMSWALVVDVRRGLLLLDGGNSFQLGFRQKKISDLNRHFSSTQ